MMVLGLFFISLLVAHAEDSSIKTIDLDQMERLSTDIKRLSGTLATLYETSEKESIHMLEIESSMMEVENLVMQLENQISTLPPSP